MILFKNNYWFQTTFSSPSSNLTIAIQNPHVSHVNQLEKTVHGFHWTGGASPQIQLQRLQLPRPQRYRFGPWCVGWCSGWGWRVEEAPGPTLGLRLDPVSQFHIRDHGAGTYNINKSQSRFSNLSKVGNVCEGSRLNLGCVFEEFRHILPCLTHKSNQQGSFIEKYIVGICGVSLISSTGADDLQTRCTSADTWRMLWVCLKIGYPPSTDSSSYSYYK